MSLDKTLSIQELFSLRTDLFSKSKVKLVRHQDSRIEYRDVIKDREKLIEYQRKQSKNVFGKTDYIVSFIGQESTKSLFFGVFKVDNTEEIENEFYYELNEVDIFSELNDRIVIEWGNATRAWHQDYNNYAKEILEILPKGYLGDFPVLTNFILDYDELKRLINNPDANRDWKTHLSSVNGVYMILDKSTGHQYIGSACGKEGIWQRWEDYVKTKDGGNQCLIELCNSEINYHKNFQYTVLQTLPSNLTKNEVIEIENLYKVKFGTKVHGLNRN